MAGKFVVIAKLTARLRWEFNYTNPVDAAKKADFLESQGYFVDVFENDGMTAIEENELSAELENDEADAPRPALEIARAMLDSGRDL